MSDTVSLRSRGLRGAGARIRSTGALLVAVAVMLAGAWALVLLSSAPSAAVAASPRQTEQLTISPASGTPDVNPQTQVSILGVAPSRIRSVRVVGVSSGVHRGHLAAYSDHRGASFVLDHPLTQGEQVTVTIGFSGRRAVHFGFSVARLAPVQPVLKIQKLQPAKLHHYNSLPLLAPLIKINKSSPRLGGDIFLTPLPSPVIHPGSNNTITINPVGPGGPMIIDGRGRLVWFHQLPAPLVAANFRPQRYLGREVLTWWQGGVTPSAFGIGEGVIASTSYRILRTVKAGNGYAADIHEFLLTPDGDALLTAYSPVLVHLPGGKPGSLTTLLDSIVQEVDIRTGLVVWEWHGLGHIPISDSYATPGTTATNDIYHVNSIQLLPHDHLLVSARDTSAIYDIDRATGRIVWKLGGKASAFKLGPGARFFFQHDAQMLPGDRISLFDDEAGPPVKAPSSRGLVLALDMRRRTAKVVRQFYRTGKNTIAESEGSFQTLPSGGVFVGFGSTPFFSEFAPTGKLLFDGMLPTDDGSYREYLFPWSATPLTRPAVVAKRVSASRVAIYASWNGATTVARWQVVAGSRQAPIAPLAGTPARGFETRIIVTSTANNLGVRALSATGQVLAKSEMVRAS